MRLLQTIGFTATSVLALSLSSVPVFAISARSDAASGSSNTVISSGSTTSATSDSQTTTSTPTTSKATKESKRDASKLKSCQKRAVAGNKKLQQAAIRGQKQIDSITEAAVRAQNTYTRRGKTLSNYDSLVSNVTAKKAAAQSAVLTVRNDQVSNNCDGTAAKDTDPAAGFKSDLKTESTALKDYKTAVKNLTVVIKSVQGTTSSNSSTTKPSGGTN
jgi:hypothetical protein